MKKMVKTIVLYFLLIMYLELWHKSFFYPVVWNIGILYTSLFSFLFALFFTFLSSLGNFKTNKVVMISIVVLLTIIFVGNYLYTTLFSIPFSVQVTSMAGGAFEFIGIIFDTIRKNLSSIMILCAPLFILLWNHKKIKLEKSFYFEKKIFIGTFLISYIISLCVLFPFKNQSKSAFRLYWKESDLVSSINLFGFLTSERLEIQRMIFHLEELLDFEEKDTTHETSKEYNKMDIDFDSLIANESDESIKKIYSYFKSSQATKKNKYTGMFKGKNLIFILAESFNSVVVNEEYTPTLYRLIHSGFHFNHFYSPLFLSTTGGEFQAMTGLIPNANTINEWHEGKVYLPYSLGTMLQKQKYTTNAYHNWEYNFYNRDNTMPALGFQNFLACNNGLEKIADCEWTASNLPEDKKLFTETLGLYMDKEPFVTYYITMSGHGPYSFDEEKRNYEVVKDLPYSDETKGYIAGQIDLDRAVKALIDALDEKGILEDTVLCIVGDHYPYSMAASNMNEMSDYPRDETFEIHHSDLIIWNKNQKTVEIDKVGSEIDILPTLLNLFGLEYDSRLMMGKDLLSESEGIALFSDLSWITDYGSYYSKSQKFDAKKEVDSNYVSQINQWVNNGIILSEKIIKEDIYRKIFPES